MDKKPTNRVYRGASFVDKKYTLNFKKKIKNHLLRIPWSVICGQKTHWIPEILVQWGYVTSIMDKIVCATQSETPSGGESLSKLKMKYGNPDWKMCNSTQILVLSVNLRMPSNCIIGWYSIQKYGISFFSDSITLFMFKNFFLIPDR